MTTPRLTRRHFSSLLAASALSLAAPSLMAQAFPDKPLRMVVAAPPGGTADILARVIADGLTKSLGQPVIVDNRPGGGGMIALQELLKSPRDGHAMLFSISGLVTEVPHAFKLPLDPMKAVVPLANMAQAGLFFVANNNVPASNLKEAIAYVKANPGKITYASYSTGTISHTLGLALNEQAGLDMTHVGYKGSAPGLNDLMGGHVNFMFDAPGSVLPMYKAGKVKVLATSGSVRNPAAPDVPTFAELGFKAMTETPWLGMFCVPEVPAPVQAKLHGALTALLSQPQVRDRWAELGMMVPAMPAPTLSYTGTTCDAPARISRSLQFESLTRATMRSDGAIERAVSATTAFDGSSSVVMSAAARVTPAVRSTVTSRASPFRYTAPAASMASSSPSVVSTMTTSRPARTAASADARPTRPNPTITTWSRRCSRTFDLLRSRSAAATSPDTNSAVSAAAEYTNTPNPAKMVAIVQTRPAVPSSFTSP